MIHRYKTFNFSMPTIAAPVAVTTNTAIETMLQLAAPATRAFPIAAWGYTIDDVPGADGVFELLETDVAATVTAHTATGIIKPDNTIQNSLATLGVSATGFTATSEGAITATRVFDVVRISSASAEGAPVLTYSYEWKNPLRMPILSPSKFLRVRSTTPTTGVAMTCWIEWFE